VRRCAALRSIVGDHTAQNLHRVRLLPVTVYASCAELRRGSELMRMSIYFSRRYPLALLGRRRSLANPALWGSKQT
jgi:hypothetical protein